MKKFQIDRDRLYLFLIVFLAIFLRIYDLGSESIWYDEACSIQIASSSTMNIFLGKAKDLGNPPLHSILLHFWIKFFGKNEVSVRSLSAIFGIFSLILIYKICNLLFNEKISLLSTFIFAISPLHVYLSQEARTYTLVTFLCLTSMLFFLKFIRLKKNIHLMGYIITTFLSIYSHYFAFFIIISQNLFLIIYWKEYKDIFYKWLIGQISVVLLFIIFWGSPFISQITQEGNLQRSATTWYKHILFFPIYYSVGDTLVWKESTLIELLIFIPFILAAFGIPFIFGTMHLLKNKKLLYFLLLWLFMPIVIPGIISLFFSPLYSSRYSIMASLAYYSLIGAGIFYFRTKLRLIFIFGIVILSAFSLIRYYSLNFKFEWRHAASFIEKNSQPKDIILFDADMGETPFSYYYKGTLKKIRLYSPPGKGKKRIIGSTVTGKPRQDFTEEVDKSERVWLALSFNITDGSGDSYENFFIKRYKILKKIEFKGIKIYLFSVK